MYIVITVGKLLAHGSKCQ